MEKKKKLCPQLYATFEDCGTETNHHVWVELREFDNYESIKEHVIASIIAHFNREGRAFNGDELDSYDVRVDEVRNLPEIFTDIWNEETFNIAYECADLMEEYGEIFGAYATLCEDAHALTAFKDYYVPNIEDCYSLGRYILDEDINKISSAVKDVNLITRLGEILEYVDYDAVGRDATTAYEFVDGYCFLNPCRKR